MAYHLIALIAVIIFSLIHLFANQTNKLSIKTRSQFLSMAGGVAIAYVFVNLLPKLAKSDLIVQQAFAGVFPYFERHVYIMALAGFLLFMVVDKSPHFLRGKGSFLLSLISYAVFNFFVGYAVVDKNDPEVQPLLLFTIAMGLHYFGNDFTLTEEHGREYQSYGKWILVFSLLLGWAAGIWFSLSATAVALLSAFIGGGVIMNVIRHELPKKNPHNLIYFIVFAGIYTAILLSVGT